MLSTLSIVSENGDILMHRSYRGDVYRQEILIFCILLSKKIINNPIYNIGSCHYIYIHINNLYFISTTKNNANIMLILKLLYTFSNLLKVYFGTVCENTVKMNFCLIYELMDEILDYGIPQVLDANVLTKYVTLGGKKNNALEDEENLKKIIIQATGSCSWRAEGIKYSKNEVMIDVVETVNALFSQKGQLLRADVTGSIILKVQLSGMPECKIGMNDKAMMVMEKKGSKSQTKTIALDDCRLHQCVRLHKFDIDKSITFVPPDGVFELMNYRTTDNVDLPFRLIPVVHVRSKSRVEISLSIKSLYNKKIFANNVVAKIPCPKNTVKGAVTKTGSGKAKYEPSQTAIVWRIRSFQGEQEHSLFADVDVASSVSEKVWQRPPIFLDFQVSSFTASGLIVRYFKAVEKSNYEVCKRIRYITKAGIYHHRI
eukprot:GHVL01002440.1.p1 GENE.GHVL01002440.1~~GHVL01002440.1.p1  ORF type:complete len:428 (+),score=79.32 GHVL01002440.1:97-1380(+)